jgi:hypothetical protein
LIEEGGSHGQWRMHDLLRLYAWELADAHADADGKQQAGDRALGYYLDAATAADQHLRALPGASAQITLGAARLEGLPDLRSW